jgi:transcriptional regulator with PAS, ATPase and Fis domain
MASFLCRECGEQTPEAFRFCPVCGVAYEPIDKTTQAGIDAFEQGEYAQALQLFQATLKKRSSSFFAFRDMGHASFHLQQDDAALNYYETALKLRHDLLDVRFNIGLIHLKRGRVGDAMFSFSETLRLIHPLTPGAFYLGLFHSQETLGVQCHLNLGMLFKERGEVERSLEQYEKVIRDYPKNVLALGGLGDCLMTLERYDEAIQVYKKALKILPDGDEKLNIQNDLGVCYFKKSEMEKAITEFKAVLQKNPDHVNAIYNLGQVYYHEGLTGRMKQDYEEFVKSSKNAASILFSLSKSMVSAAAAPEHRGDETLLVGESPAMKKIHDLIKRAAASDATVLVLGENGTGKELVAKSIHELSARHDKPFVPIACSALSESLLESELFGHEKGSFTGAIGQKLGKFEAANLGSVFLDEIGEISLSTQVKLLRVLQERQLERVGGTQTVKVDIRVIAATNRDLKQAIQQGRFREDLFYRLNVIVIEMPALRVREGDLPILVKHLLAKLKAKRQTQFEGISEDALRIMRQYRWPGNVRELENVIERIVTLNDDVIIKPEHLPAEMLGGTVMVSTEKDTVLPSSGVLKSIEKDMILKVLQESRFNKKEAAERLGISRPTLYLKIRKYGLKVD